ncbi:MAG: sigma-70 family RNA polymerase sigma factor [Chloroflexota bacterium]
MDNTTQMIVLVLPDITTDDERLARAKQGDKTAIGDIYRSYFEPIYQFIRLRVGDAQLAEDLTSDVFIKFIKALKNDRAPHTSLRGWIFRVARNVIYDYYGKEQAIPAETIEQWIDNDDDTNPEVQALRTIEAERARQVIRMLAPAQQEVLILRFDQQLSLQETADIMDKKVNAIKALQFRAVNTLRQILQDDEPDATKSEKDA